MAAVTSLAMYGLPGQGKEVTGVTRSPSIVRNATRTDRVVPIIKSVTQTAPGLEAHKGKSYYWEGDLITSHIDLKTNLSKTMHLPKEASVIGHRGTGANMGPSSLESIEGYFAGDIRENTLLAYNTAAALGADFVELDVQVTKDGVAVIWHDDYIYYKQIGAEEVLSHQIKDLTLAEFKQISYLGTICPKKPLVLMRKFNKQSDEMRPWVCRQEDQLPTLEEVLSELPLAVGINIELKYEKKALPVAELEYRVKNVLACIGKFNNANRRIVLSSFYPDACIEARKIQNQYPVMMLTDAGFIIFEDVRRNSFKAALDIAKEHQMAGVVLWSNVAPTLEMVQAIEREDMKLMSYGKKNNDSDFSVEQIQLGVHSVVCDDVQGVHACIAKHLIRSS